MVGLFSNEMSFYKSSFRRYGVVSPLFNIATAFVRASSNTSKVTSAVLLNDTKQGEKLFHKMLLALHLVGVRGFEPPTTSTPLKCATGLRYTPSFGTKLV